MGHGAPRGLSPSASEASPGSPAFADHVAFHLRPSARALSSPWKAFPHHQLLKSHSFLKLQLKHHVLREANWNFPRLKQSCFWPLLPIKCAYSPALATLFSTFINMQSVIQVLLYVRHNVIFLFNPTRIYQGSRITLLLQVICSG